MDIIFYCNYPPCRNFILWLHEIFEFFHLTALSHQSISILISNIKADWFLLISSLCNVVTMSSLFFYYNWLSGWKSEYSVLLSHIFWYFASHHTLISSTVTLAAELMNSSCTPTTRADNINDNPNPTNCCMKCWCFSSFFQYKLYCDFFSCNNTWWWQCSICW